MTNLKQRIAELEKDYEAYSQSELWERPLEDALQIIREQEALIKKQAKALDTCWQDDNNSYLDIDLVREAQAEFNNLYGETDAK